MSFASAASGTVSTSVPREDEREWQDNFGKMVIILEGYGMKRRASV